MASFVTQWLGLRAIVRKPRSLLVNQQSQRETPEVWSDEWMKLLWLPTHMEHPHMSRAHLNLQGQVKSSRAIPHPKRPSALLSVWILLSWWASGHSSKASIKTCETEASTPIVLMYWSADQITKNINERVTIPKKIKIYTPLSKISRQSVSSEYRQYTDTDEQEKKDRWQCSAPQGYS